MGAIILLFLLITIPSILCGVISLLLRKKEIEKLFGEGSCHVLKVRKLGGCKVVEE